MCRVTIPYRIYRGMAKPWISRKIGLPLAYTSQSVTGIYSNELAHNVSPPNPKGDSATYPSSSTAVADVKSLVDLVTSRTGQLNCLICPWYRVFEVIVAISGDHSDEQNFSSAKYRVSGSGRACWRPPYDLSVTPPWSYAILRASLPISAQNR